MRLTTGEAKSPGGKFLQECGGRPGLVEAAEAGAEGGPGLLQEEVGAEAGAGAGSLSFAGGSELYQEA